MTSISSKILNSLSKNNKNIIGTKQNKKWKWHTSNDIINRYYEYGHIVRTLVYNIDDVNKLGAVYLKELLTCISHCIEEQEHQEDD